MSIEIERSYRAETGRSGDRVYWKSRLPSDYRSCLARADYPLSGFVVTVSEGYFTVLIENDYLDQYFSLPEVVFFNNIDNKSFKWRVAFVEEY